MNFVTNSIKFLKFEGLASNVWVNNQCNSQLHRFTTRKIPQKVWGGATFLTHTVVYSSAGCWWRTCSAEDHRTSMHILRTHECLRIL